MPRIETPTPFDDAALPRGFSPPPIIDREIAGISYRSTRWTSDALAALAARTVAGAPALAAATEGELFSAWRDAVDDFLPGGPRSSALAEALTPLTGLSRPGLVAAIETVLGGAGDAIARQLFADARSAASDPDPRPILVVLSSNLPALALQPLLAALALRRPVIVKSASSEPLFTPAFVGALGERAPAVGAAWTAVTWPGGDRTLERPVFAASERILVYGETETIDDLERRAPGRVVGFGPKLSLGFASTDAEPQAAARGFARDIALFDQRGCLSVQAIYTAGDPDRLAVALAQELGRIARELPPGPVDPASAARVQAERLDADLRGLARPELALDFGTVIVAPDPKLRPSPGLRSVRVHRASPEVFVEALAGWKDRVQGIAIAGSTPPELGRALERLGIGRVAPAGELQQVDATWHNGGKHPIVTLTEPLSSAGRHEPSTPGRRTPSANRTRAE